MFKLNIFNRIAPLWEYPAVGKFWRIVPVDGSRMIIEDRDVVEKLTEYAMIDPRNGRESWRRSFDERWWIGIEAVQGDFVIFHGYSTPELPEHAGITVVELSTGKVVWEVKQIKYLFHTDEIIMALKTSPLENAQVAFRLATGAQTDAGTGMKASLAGGANFLGGSIKYPELRQEGSEIITPKSGRVLRRLPGFTADEYITVQNITVVSGYHRIAGARDQTLCQEIIIIDRQKDKIIFRDVILGSANRPVQGMFLSIENILLYLKEQKKLAAVRLF